MRIGIPRELKNHEYRAAGAQVVGVSSVWSDSDLIVKVKEPVPEEYSCLRAGQVLFVYLHLAASWPSPTAAGVAPSRPIPPSRPAWPPTTGHSSPGRSTLARELGSTHYRKAARTAKLSP